MKKRIGDVDTKFYVENGKVYPVFVDEKGKYISNRRTRSRRKEGGKVEEEGGIIYVKPSSMFE